MVYVANTGSKTISVIDCNGRPGQTNIGEKTIPVGSTPDGVAVNPNTNMVYVGIRDYNTVSVIDGSTKQYNKKYPSRYFPCFCKR